MKFAFWVFFLIMFASLDAGSRLSVKDKKRSTEFVASQEDLKDLHDIIEKALRQAIKVRNLKAVKAALDLGASTHSCDEHNLTPLMWASSIGAPEIAQELLKRNVVRGQQNKQGITALMLACEHGHQQIVRLLLFGGSLPEVNQAKQLVNQASHEGVTPLMMAAQAGNAAIVQLLLEFGADSAAKDKQGNTIHYYINLNRDKASAQHIMKLIAAAQQSQATSL